MIGMVSKNTHIQNTETLAQKLTAHVTTLTLTLTFYFDIDIDLPQDASYKHDKLVGNDDVFSDGISSDKPGIDLGELPPDDDD